MSVFVTGSSGVVGRAVLAGIVAEGHPVTALVRSAAAARTALDLGAERVVEGDVLDRAALLEGMRDAATVFHIAGMNAFCLADPEPMYRVNIEGSRLVAETAARAGVARLVYTSSASALGETHGSIGREDSPHRGSYLSHYERSKHLAEQAVDEVAARTGLDVVSVLPSSVQGPGRASGTGKLFVDIVNGRLPAIIDTRLSIVDIDDCAAGHLAAWHDGTAGQRYVLNGASMTVREGLDLLEQVAGVTVSLPTLPGPVVSAGVTLAEVFTRARGRTPRFCREMVATLRHGHHYDGSRASAELGLVYTPIETTLRRTLRWFAEQGLLTVDLPGLADPAGPQT